MKQDQPNSSKKVTDAEIYWRNRLAGLTTPTPLVVDKPATSLLHTSTKWEEQQESLSPEQTTAVCDLTQCEDIDLNSLLQGAWALLLSRYSGEDDVCFGIASAEKWLPARLHVPEATPARTWIGEIRAQGETQENYDGVSLAKIRQWSEMPADLPLFESALSRDAEAPDEDIPLSLNVTSGAEIKLRARYDAHRFEAEVIRRMLGHLKTLLAGMAENPDTPVSRLQLLTARERHQFRVEWNATQVPFPDDACLHQLFEAQAERTPDATAAVFNGQELTYAELNHRSNQVAHYLRKQGVGPDVLVGVFMQRSLEMVIGLYGILKAGGAYVPLDPTYPADRLAFMMDDTQAPVLLTQSPLVGKLPDHSAKTVVIDTEWEQIAQEKQAACESGVTPEHLAYVIYTSGSTGTPKAAVLNHRGRVNNFCDFNRRYSTGPDDKVLGLASLSFDMHAYDIFGLMAVGGTTVIVEAPAVLEPARWAELMLAHGITVWHSVPALLEMYVDHIEANSELHPGSLRLVLLGGDWIPVNLPDRLKAIVDGVHVVSMGGATECSMDSTIYDIEQPSSNWKSIPYGVPMANQLAYILDRHFNPVPVGVPGELYLGGIGVGRGYHNRPELTAEKFVPNPFSSLPGDRMYRTGDLARYMPDGTLELLGRIDFQVKVRGYRVELGEITSTLTQHPAVKEAVVVAQDVEKGNPARGKQLVGYIVPDLQYDGEAEFTPDEWQEEQVSQWQAIYEETYSQSEADKDPTFNIIGWNSSYTGLPIPEQEMAEWLQQSVERVLALQPKRVLEIACGSGLLLFKIAPHCEAYLGTDFSEAGLDYIREQLKVPERQMPQVSLEQRMADNFDGMAPHAFDVAILHSVVQLFPSLDYFMRVLKNLVETVKPGGFIYVGDVISLPLMEAFHTSVQLYQAPARLTTEELRERIKKARLQEEQLFIDPDFFHALKQEFPGITRVQTQLRRGRFLNEMTQFRYDVILQIGEGETNGAVNHLDWQAWQEGEDSVSQIRDMLAAENPEWLAIKNIPNTRLRKEMKALQLLRKGRAPETVGELRNQVNAIPGEQFVDPEELWSVGDELSYDVIINWSDEADGYFDIIFRQKSDEAPAPALFGEEKEVRAKAWREYANNPLQSVLARRLIPDVRGYLQEQLPDYMVPYSFMLLDPLPLSPNGKIDRRALPPPDHSRPQLTSQYVAPSTPLEEVVTAVWAEIFELEKVGVHDNFLEMGGHSLLATQIMARLQEVFPLQLPLRYLFGSPTVAGLSQRIQEKGKEEGVDVVEIARAVLTVNQLSDEEVKTMLAAKER